MHAVRGAGGPRPADYVYGKISPRQPPEAVGERGTGTGIGWTMFVAASVRGLSGFVCNFDVGPHHFLLYYQ